MSKIAERLKEEYDMDIVENNDSNRQFIDFSIENEDRTVATVWGDRFDDVDWECSHPYECVDFGDDTEDQGECLLCGAYCDWHKVPDEYTPGHPEPHEWYPRRDIGGIIKLYIEELREDANGAI